MAEKNKPLANALKKLFAQKAPQQKPEKAAEHLDGTTERVATLYEFTPNTHEFLSFNGKGTAH